MSNGSQILFYTSKKQTCGLTSNTLDVLQQQDVCVSDAQSIHAGASPRSGLEWCIWDLLQQRSREASRAPIGGRLPASARQPLSSPCLICISFFVFRSARLRKFLWLDITPGEMLTWS